MKHLCDLLLIFSCCIFYIVLPEKVYGQDYGHKPGYNLVWHDEFNDSATTAALWERGFPWGQWAGGLQYYQRTGNHTFENGLVNLIIKKEYVNGEVAFWDEQGNYEPYYKDFDYSAGMLYSKQSFKNGFFEGRFKSQAGRSFHNSFWMYGEKDAEIDIFEIFGSKPGRAQMTLHWRDKDPLINSSQSFTFIEMTPHFGETFHTFAAEWRPDRVRWYLDNQLVQESNFTNFIRDRHVPDVPLNIILSSGISGHDSLPDETTPFPAVLQFDYVRAYQNSIDVAAPVIIGQRYTEYKDYQPFTFSPTWLTVVDHYKTYPYGFRTELLPGQHYTVIGDKIAVEQGYKNTVTVNVRVNDGLKNSDTYAFQLYPSIKVGLQETPGQAWSFYPNPAGDVIWVQAPAAAVIEIYNSAGSLVYTAPLEAGVTRADISELAAGFYLLSIRREQEIPLRSGLFLK